MIRKQHELLAYAEELRSVVQAFRRFVWEQSNKLPPRLDHVDRLLSENVQMDPDYAALDWEPPFASDDGPGSMITVNDLTLMCYLYDRHMRIKSASVRHADELNHIDDLRACWKNLRLAGFVDDNETSWSLSEKGLEAMSAAEDEP